MKIDSFHNLCRNYQHIHHKLTLFENTGMFDTILPICCHIDCICKFVNLHKWRYLLKMSRNQAYLSEMLLVENLMIVCTCCKYSSYLDPYKNSDETISRRMIYTEYDLHLLSISALLAINFWALKCLHYRYILYSQ